MSKSIGRLTTMGGSSIGVVAIVAKMMSALSPVSASVSCLVVAPLSPQFAKDLIVRLRPDAGPTTAFVAALL
jgi:hypothetical protein